MKTITFNVGTDIYEAARQLIISSPATGKFNGITITAENVSVPPKAIVDQFNKDYDAACKSYEQTPEFKARMAKYAAECIAAKEKIVTLLNEGFTCTSAMVSWCYNLLEAGSRVGFTESEKARIKELLHLYGVTQNMHVGDSRCQTHKTIRAQWIAGQMFDVLDSRMGGEALFGHAEEWLKKYSPVAVLG